MRRGRPRSRPRRSFPLGSFVGRDEQVARVQALLRDGARLVTILGPPGIGKTRLATRCLELETGFEDEGGAWFCDLSEVATAAGLVHAVAALFPDHSAEAGGADLVDVFADAGPTVLVL